MAVERIQCFEELPDEVRVTLFLVHPGEQGQETEGLGKVFFFRAGLEILHLGLVPAFVAGIEL